MDEDRDAVVVQEMGDEEGGGEDFVDVKEPASPFHLSEGEEDGREGGRRSGRKRRGKYACVSVFVYGIHTRETAGGEEGGGSREGERSIYMHAEGRAVDSLGAAESLQGVPALAYHVDVGHAHKHHLANLEGEGEGEREGRGEGLILECGCGCDRGCGCVCVCV